MSSQPEDGKEKCPYGPTTGYTALIIGQALQLLPVTSRVSLDSFIINRFFLADQEMYSASQYEFRSFPDIRRNFGSLKLKTEDAPTRWLNGELIAIIVITPSGLNVVILVILAPSSRSAAPASFLCFHLECYDM